MRRRFRAPVVTALCALVVGASYPAAADTVVPVTGARTLTTARVAVSQTYRASGPYTVRGHGWGHGHGMSQYGAYGAALKGLDVDQILAFYYPGTTLGTATGKIRVRIMEATSNDLTVLARSGLAVRQVGTSTWYPVPQDVGATRWRLEPTSSDKNAVSYRAAGSWHRWSPGGQKALPGEAELSASGPLTLVLPSGTAEYRGWLRAARPAANPSDRETVNVLPVDKYVRGVVASEMPASWSPAAVQAQAVAARTYAEFERAASVGDPNDLCDTSSCQVYRGVAGEDDRSNAAVKATKGQVLLYKGQPAFTQFASSSGGWTSDGGEPYLPAQKDPYDGVPSNPNHSWSLKLRPTRIAAAFPRIGKLRRIHVTARDGHGQWHGRVESMTLVGSKGKHRMTGDDFRLTFGLKSDWFTFK